MDTRPAPPPISPRQMDILRAVAAMAWADGVLEPNEIRLMLDEFATLFATTDEQRATLKQRLREYLGQNIPLEEAIPRLKTPEDRKMVLRLAYQVIQSSRRHPDEPVVNLDEAAAYQRLVRMLDLPAEEVADIEASVTPNDADGLGGIVQTLATKLQQLIHG